MSQTANDLATAFTKLSSTANNLLTADPQNLSQYKMIWAPPAWIKGERKEKNKGLWTDGVRTSPVFPLLGVVDGRKSKLDDYGNCFFEEQSGGVPDRYTLSKSKFTVAITYPTLPTGHVDAHYASAISNQIYCMDAIQDNAVAALTAVGEEDASTTDWARFETSDDGTVGWLHASIGKVYESKTRKVKGKQVINRNLVQPPVPGAIEKPDIVDDRLHFLERTKNHNLKHNEYLPCFLPNGERIGRTPSELRREIYDGRWVRLDVELLMWNMKAEGKRIFQLQVVRLEVISAAPASLGGAVFASLDPNDYKKKPVKGTDDPPVPPTLETGSVEKTKPDGENASQDEDTVSESSTKTGNKRSATNQPSSSPKKRGGPH